MNDEGNLQDASALAAIAALKDARFPKLTEKNEIDYDAEKTKNKLPLAKIPVEITVIKVGDQFFVDPLVDEEEQIEARLTVAVTEKGTICALQKGGELPLSIEDIETMISIAQKIAPTLRNAL